MDVKDLLIIQEDRLQKVNKAESNYKKSPKERITTGYLQARLETLETLWKDFTDSHLKIITSVHAEKRGDLTYFNDGVYDNFEECYTYYKGSLREALLNIRMTQTQVTDRKANTSCDVKLPKIQLNSFSGKYSEWQSFYDLFTSVVHNNTNISSVQKLHYLKSTLTGEAEVLIRNLPTTELNYEAAWEKLTKRYDNKRYNCNAILRTLFSQRSITTESANAIKSILDTTTSCLTSLNNMEISTNSWDPIVVYLVVSRLDQESLRQWELNISGISSNQLPKWNDLVVFLESRFRTLEMIDSNKPIAKVYQANPKRVDKVKSFATVQNDERGAVKSTCTMCSGDHYLYQCKSFSQLTPRERQDIVQTRSLCFNCLSPTHSVRNCRQSTCCRRCGRRHHSLLHIEREINYQGPTNTTNNIENIHTSSKLQGIKNQPGTTNQVNVVANFAKEEEVIGMSDVLLATALVRAYSRSGQSNLLRVLIDQGSQASFVTEETVQLLGLNRVPVSGCVSGLGDGQLRIKYMVSFDVQSQRDPVNSIQVTAYVLKSLISRIPSSNVTSPDWLDIENLSLADPGYISPGRIDLLLGAEIYSEILLGDMIKHPQGHLIAQNTIFGWVISGKASKSISAERVISLHVHVKEDKLLKQFWELENEPNTIQKKLTKTEEKCEEIFETTTIRNKKGRNVVRLPFTNQDPECQYGKLKDITQRRFRLIKRKFQKNVKFKEEVIQEYLYLNHLMKIQKIVLRSNPSESMGQYELLTLTLGTACAPHLAVRSPQQLADDEQSKYPVHVRLKTAKN